MIRGQAFDRGSGHFILKLAGVFQKLGLRPAPLCLGKSRRILTEVEVPAILIRAIDGQHASRAGPEMFGPFP